MRDLSEPSRRQHRAMVAFPVCSSETFPAGEAQLMSPEAIAEAELPDVLSDDHEEPLTPAITSWPPQAGSSAQHELALDDFVAFCIDRGDRVLLPRRPRARSLSQPSVRVDPSSHEPALDDGSQNAVPEPTATRCGRSASAGDLRQADPQHSFPTPADQDSVHFSPTSSSIQVQAELGTGLRRIANECRTKIQPVKNLLRNGPKQMSTHIASPSDQGQGERESDATLEAVVEERKCTILAVG